jgi:hypothetical protein
MKNQTDVYEKITASTIEAMKAGCGKFEMPGIRSKRFRPTQAANAGTAESIFSYCGQEPCNTAIEPSVGQPLSNGANY